MKHSFLYCSIFLLSSFIYAHDEQLSLHAFSSPVNVFDPGYGLEFSTTLGNRTVFGLSAGLTEPTAAAERQIVIRSEARLLYSSELKTHWYPAVSAQWVPQANQLRGWLGVGFQREIIEELGLFGQANWQPNQHDFQVMLGLRFWFSRLGSLDARVKYAEPKGAVFESGQTKSNGLTLDVDTANRQEETAAISSETTEPVITALPSEPEPEVSAVAEDSNIKANVENTNKQTILLPGWYVHLGVFRQLESLQGLEQDERLVPYRHLAITWYDDNKAAFRFMLGPLSKPRSVALKQTFDSQNLDSFLYQIR